VRGGKKKGCVEKRRKRQQNVFQKRRRMRFGCPETLANEFKKGEGTGEEGGEGGPEKKRAGPAEKKVREKRNEKKGTKEVIW